MKRKITKAVINPRSTCLTLECQHQRSIGGHVFADGKPADDPKKLVGTLYDCKEAHCGRM